MEKDVLKRLKELGLDHPLKDAGIKSVDKKWVDIQRKHDVLFIKGDQVAVVLKGWLWLKKIKLYCKTNKITNDIICHYVCNV